MFHKSKEIYQIQCMDSVHGFFLFNFKYLDVKYFLRNFKYNSHQFFPKGLFVMYVD